LLFLSVLTAAFGGGVAGGEAAPDRKKEDRRAFQDQEIITARPFTWVFNPGDPPRLIWRDVDEVRRLGSDGRLRVRWFDNELKETDVPKHAGRWGALVEGVAPNGTLVRRSMTLYCRAPGFFIYFPPELSNRLAYVPGPISADVWREHADEIARVWKDVQLRGINDTEAGAALISALCEAKPLGRAGDPIESAAVSNEEFQLALKLKAQSMQSKVRGLRPPRHREAGAAPVLREGSAGEAGVRADTHDKLDAVCRAWAEDSGERFATLVARHGVIVLHAAYGKDKDGRPIGLDYRCDVASITKNTTALVFAKFLDQGLIGLDDSVATIFPDYPKGDPHVPTFRQCFTHTSGLAGHGDWGGVRNPQLENIILNGIDANEPGKAYNYTGMGFELAAKAMEIVGGESFVRLYHRHLYLPLGMAGVPLANAGAGAQYTARELATLGQLLANRGSYGDLEFFSPATFGKLLPEPLGRRYQGIKEEEGVGMHWMKVLRPGAAGDSNREQDFAFSRRTIGHGSLTSCIFLIDLDRGVVVAQVRQQAGPRFGEWAAKFYEAIADGLTSAKALPAR
jgi:CubicO group peptidase (beta-lactamase class C family)